MRPSLQRLEDLTEMGLVLIDKNEHLHKAIEEAYELIEAFRTEDNQDIKEELVDNAILNYRLLKMYKIQKSDLAYFGGKILNISFEDQKELCEIIFKDLIGAIENGEDSKICEVSKALFPKLVILITFLFPSEIDYHKMLNKKLDKFEFKYLKVAT